MSTRTTFAAACAGAALACAVQLTLPPAARGQRMPGLAAGAGHAGQDAESFRFRTVGGSEAEVSTTRQVLKVPASYGEPFAVSESKGVTQVWYRGPAGVRNVVLREGAGAVHLAPGP